MSQVQTQTQQITVSRSELEAMIEQMVSQKVNEALSNLPVTQASEGKPRTQATAKQVEAIDWTGMSNADLWTTKVKGASEEKIRRSYEAIALYNDRTYATVTCDH